LRASYARIMDVSSPVRKLIRAREHIYELQESQRTWRESGFYEVITHDNLRESTDPEVRIMWKFRVTNPPPGAWGAIAGDIVTNLRAALDHAMYVVVSNGLGGSVPESLERRIQFPIEDTAQGFAGRIQPFRHALTNETVAILEEHQPYRDEGLNPLVWVRELSNRDKHRALVFTPVATTAFRFAAKIPGLDVKLQAGDRIEDGKTIAIAKFPRAGADSHFDTQQRIEWIEHVETHTKYGALPTSVVIESMYETALDIVATLIHDFASDVDVLVISQQLEVADARWAAVSESLSSDPPADS